jgi:hypothetical protein
MASVDARARTIQVLTTQGVVFGIRERSPLEAERAFGVWQRLVEEEKVLEPGPGTVWPDGRPGGPHVLDHDLVRSRVRGNDALSLTLLVLTSRGVGNDEDDALPADEALTIYQLLVEEHAILVPSPSTYYPHEWPAEP